MRHSNARKWIDRRLVVALGLGALAWLPPTAAAQDDRTEQERINRTFELGADGLLDLSNVSGRIVVRGVDGSTVTVDATKFARPRGQESAAEALGRVEIEFDQRGDRLEVRTRYDGGRNRRVRVDFDVSVPRGARVTLHSVSGDIDVRDVNGELRAETVSGVVAVASAGRLGSARSVSGDVQLESITAAPSASIGSVSGDIDVRSLTADRLELETVSGEMRLREIACSGLDVSTVSGEVSYEGSLDGAGRYEIRSHSGDVTLVLAGDTGFDLTADTFSGDFEFDLPITLRGDRADRDDQRARDDRRRHGRSVRGSYGDGGARLDVVTFSGDLMIRQRD